MICDGIVLDQLKDILNDNILRRRAQKEADNDMMRGKHG